MPLNLCRGLFRCCAVCAVYAAGGTSEQLSSFVEFGENVGLCFQIKDDIFDYYSNDVGKPTGNDMREGKLTLPIIYAVRTQGDEHIRTMIDRLKEGELSDVEINELITFAKACGGIEYAEQTMQKYRQKALALLPENIDENVKNAVITYMDVVINRKK